MARKTEREIEPAQEACHRVRVEDLVGHRGPAKWILRALARGALAPSLLFTGPAGVGKATLARMVAAALLCERPGPGACGSCLHCRKMIKGIHPDFRTISYGVGSDGKPSKVIQVDQVREDISKVLSLPPYEGKKLLFLIDPADAMNANAQNALLKSLEEPPPYVQFLLVTAVPGKLLPTVHSRCQRVGLAPLSKADISGWLALRGEIPPEEKDLALAWAAGRPGRLAGFEAETFRQRRRELLDLLGKGLDASAAGPLLKVTEKFSKERLPDFLQELSVLLADAFRCAEGHSPRIHGDIGPDLRRACEGRGVEGSRHLADRLAEIPAFLPYNPNPRLLLDWLFFTP